MTTEALSFPLLGCSWSNHLSNKVLLFLELLLSLFFTVWFCQDHHTAVSELQSMILGMMIGSGGRIRDLARWHPHFDGTSLFLMSPSLLLQGHVKLPILLLWGFGEFRSRVIFQHVLHGGGQITSVTWSFRAPPPRRPLF